MGDPARRPATYDDVLAAPEGMTAEIIAGELWLSPRPAGDHASVALGIGGDLREPFGRRRGGPGPGGWWILIEPELHLGVPAPKDVVAVPDLAAWRRERMPVIPRVVGFALPPDWVCEILSPGPRNTRRDRIVKPHVYAACGIPHVWIVDPVAETLEVFRLQGSTYNRAQAFAGDVRVRAEPFDAVELDIGGWWLETEAPEGP
jgi:Uma2 family endonuclease